MSIVTNIQGSMTQIQTPQHLQQQHTENIRMQQVVGEQQITEQLEKRQATVNTKENISMEQSDHDGSNKDPRKQKNKKRILPLDQDRADLGDRMGGGLINTLA